MLILYGDSRYPRKREIYIILVVAFWYASPIFLRLYSTKYYIYYEMTAFTYYFDQNGIVIRLNIDIVSTFQETDERYSIEKGYFL